MENKTTGISGATGEMTPVKGPSNEDIQMENMSICHRVLIADISDEVIIGLDLLKHYKIILDIGSGLIRIGEEKLMMMNNESNKSAA